MPSGDPGIDVPQSIMRIFRGSKTGSRAIDHEGWTKGAVDKDGYSIGTTLGKTELSEFVVNVLETNG